MPVRRGTFASTMLGVVLGVSLCAAFAALTASRAQSAALEADSTRQTGPIRVLSYEPFKPLVEQTPPGARKASNGSVNRLRFDAYGRRFSLTLEKNSRLSQALAPSAQSSQDGPALSLYQGTIENIPGSWVRMSAKGQTIRGMIWDGRDLYVVDLAEALRDSLVAPLSVDAASSVIFRLADTQVEPGASFCGADSDSGGVGARSGKSAYTSLLNELKGSPVIMQAAGASVRLQLAALGDPLFRARFASEQQARDEILLRLNNVDGIFSSQLGVEIQVPTLKILDPATNTLSATTVPGTLLSELGMLRRNSPELHSRGLTHLFTGRNLDGDTVGIAYTDTLCRQQYGVGLTEVNNRSSWIESLIAAHEIGHNFGAAHDGEGQCAGTPQNEYVMSPAVGQNASTFSQCSLNAMLPRVQSAQCITALPPADLSVASDLGTLTRAVARPFAWELLVTNSGGSSAIDARATLLVPPVVIVDEAWIAGGTCTSGAGVISCEMGDIPAGSSRVIHLSLRSNVIGSNSIAARVSAQNDAQSGNNAGDGTLVIDPEADLGVTLQGPATTQAGATLTAAFAAANLAVIDAANVNVEIALAGGLTATTAEVAGGSCVVQPALIRCTLPSLSANATVSGTFSANTSAIGTATLQARVFGNYVDPAADNNTAEASIVIGEPATTPATAANRGGGGGGSIGIVFLLGLGGLIRIRRVARS